MIRRLFLLLMCFLSCISLVQAKPFQDTANRFSLELPQDWYVARAEDKYALFTSTDKGENVSVLFLPEITFSYSQGEELLLLGVCNDLMVKKIPGSVKDGTTITHLAGQMAVTTRFTCALNSNTPAKGEVSSFWVNDSIWQVFCLKRDADKSEKMTPTVLQSIKLPALTANDYLRQGAKFNDAKQPDEAVSAFINAKKLTPHGTEPLYRLAYTYAEQGKYEQAIQEITKAIEMKPKNAFYYHERAYSYYKLRNGQAALDDDNMAIQLDPSYALYYAGRGNAYALLGKYEEAFTDFQKCVALKDNSADLQFNFGQLYELMGKRDLALPFYQKTLEDPKVPDRIKGKAQARVDGDWANYTDWI